MRSLRYGGWGTVVLALGALLLLPEAGMAQRLRSRASSLLRGRSEREVYYVLPGPLYYPRFDSSASYYQPYRDVVPAYAGEARPAYRTDTIPTEEYIGPAPRELPVRPVGNDTSRPATGSATVDLRLPTADAEVWVQGKKLESTARSAGSIRRPCRLERNTRIASRRSGPAMAS